LTASIVRRPNPGMTKICSVITAPEMSAPSWRPTTVTTVSMLLRIAWLTITWRSESPFARAVRT
jgi:hypothetical protein